jgi:hypothetical protein
LTVGAYGNWRSDWRFHNDHFGRILHIVWWQVREERLCENPEGIAGHIASEARVRE